MIPFFLGTFFVADTVAQAVHRERKRAAAKRAKKPVPYRR